VALALFKYGVVRNPSELAVALRIPESTATELCRDLVAAALLDEVD
jgi:DNA-binding IclR family transcriptional regulator